MEKNNIEITKDEAIKYYNSDNDTLREITLRAFSEEELNVLTYDRIIRESFSGRKIYYPSKNVKIGDANINSHWSNNPDPSVYFETTNMSVLKYMAVVIKLINIAAYFNEGEIIDDEDGYYTIDYGKYSYKLEAISKNHNYTMIPVKFQSQDEAEMAISLLTEEEKSWLTNLNY